MKYIPHVKARIEELTPRWRKRRLSQSELSEFHSLLDEVVIEARESRSAFVCEEDLPENYLVDLFREKIDAVLKSRLFKKGEQIRADAAREANRLHCAFTETPIFNDWRYRAFAIVRLEILGDAADRADRRREIEEFFHTFVSSVDKSLALQHRQLHGKYKGCLRQIRADKKYLNGLCDRGIDGFGEDDRVAPEIDDFDESLARFRAVRYGVGYDPHYIKNHEVTELHQYIADALPVLEQTMSRSEAVEWLESEIEIPIATVEARYNELVQKQPNLCQWLFGFKSVLGRRLHDLLKQEQVRHKGMVSLNDCSCYEKKRAGKSGGNEEQDPTGDHLDEQDYTDFCFGAPMHQDGQVAETAATNSRLENLIANGEITRRESQVIELLLLKCKKVEIAKKLGITKGRVSQICKKLREKFFIE